MKNSILLTAFPPFLNHRENVSEIVMRALAKERRDLETLLLPVSFQSAFAEFKKHWQHEGPFKAVVMLGQASGRSQIGIERVALNWMESRAVDNDGQSPSGSRIVKNAPDSYINDFFPSAWIQRLNEIAPTATSFSAGAYVCNNLYFQVMHELRAAKTPVFFVHLPLLAKPGAGIGAKPGAGIGARPEAGSGPEADSTPATGVALDLQKRVVAEFLNLVHSL